MKILIIDYGMGNLRSVQKAFERLNIGAKISNDKNEILSAEKLVLPGVGHFAKGIENLKVNGLFDSLNDAVLIKKIPILGICLGMQLMTKHSDEGNVDGFGWIDAETLYFKNIDNLRIPHMGWNNLVVENKSNILTGINDEDLFYFVHSYYVKCHSPNDVVSKTTYGIDFVSSFNKENIYGCQFHPEKSHDSGFKIINNFIGL